jgi:Ca2+-binding EF-hand superfamily protein
MHPMIKLSFLAGTALLAATGVAFAQPGPAGDRNADVTRQQVIERVDQRFARLDVDRDGRVTPDEARQAHEQRRAERAGRLFERLDSNNDGSISRAEFDQHRAQRAERRGEHGMRGPGRGMRGHRMAMRMFGEQGFVTAEQMRERALARFDRLDSNRDGTVTAAEREQAREHRRERRMERRRNAD